MITAFVLAVIALVLFGPVPIFLERETWPLRAPRAAVVLWQSIGLAGSLAAVGSGLAVAVAPLHGTVPIGVARLGENVLAGHALAGLGLYGALGLTMATDVTIVLAGGLAVTIVRTMHRRVRHRRLLDLVGTPDPGLNGAFIVDRAEPVAYCLPGVRSRIALSAGALLALTPKEVQAVIAHERGHVHARHDLVMLPFASMVDLLRWIPYARIAPSAVCSLLEMAADDFSARLHGRRTVASALVHLVNAGAGTTPVCALAATESSVVVRVRRLLGDEESSPVPAIAGSLLAAIAIGLPLVSAIVPVLR